jgi:hypothetical protein
MFIRARPANQKAFAVPSFICRNAPFDLGCSPAPRKTLGPPQLFPPKFSREFHWHINCEAQARTAQMATKMKLLKMLQETKGLAQITNRKPLPRPPMLYLMQLRSQGQPASTPRRRLTIEAWAIPTPLPIKINHIKTDNPALPVVVA